ncbi:hypothetical protein HF521_016236 [Silurus meridionalis]|uniref:DUF4592 domain-containing protein n=1 Tax=Silurus meridionalis TaxID=175797 RepID=A0A8T0BV95_SILME|nr:hypothetical protein HF521_016236 [Silurus meridionalis]
MKQSKSAIDITQGILDLEDICCFQGRLRTRSLSHDFLSEQHQSDSEPIRALSQENVHGKIQALQKKLQTQKMHLGPPPLVIAIKQMEDHQHPSKVLTLSENLPHKFHLKSSSQGVLPLSINPILPLFCTSPPSPGVDFNTLPQFIPCLDNSAARHRMSIKPRNQRASTKSRRIPTSDGGRPCSERMIILERPESKIEDGIDDPKEMPNARSYSSQIIRPGKGFTTPAIKCPTSPLKLLKRADDYHLHAVCQSKEKEESALSISADVGTKQILKSDVGMAAKRPNSAGPTRLKGNENHKESLYSSKLKGVEGSAVSTEYTPHLISLGTQQSHPEIDKEQNTVATHAKSNALNRSRVQDTIQEHQLQSQPIKPLLQHRNALPLDNKYEGRNIHLISLMQHSSGEGCLHESTTQQRSLSFSVSSENIHERQRTRSFNEQVEQAGGNKEHVLSLIKPSTNLKTLDLHKNAQLKAIGNATSQTGASEISTKPRDLKIIVSAGQECGDSLENKTCNMTVETQGEVEEVDKANKEMKMNKVSAEQKEEISAEINVKQHNTKVKTAPWLTESTTHTAISQNDSKVGPERETYTVLRSPPLYNNELFIVAECPVFPSIRPQSARMDQEKAELIRFPDFQASAGSPVNITRSTLAH